jgi:hypothetical protein
MSLITNYIKLNIHVSLEKARFQHITATHTLHSVLRLRYGARPRGAVKGIDLLAPLLQIGFAHASPTLCSRDSFYA